jgi:ribonuclease HI
MSYQLFTDGACSGNPGPGGWAYRLERDDLPDFSMEQVGREDETTNNRMELMAVIEGLRSIGKGEPVVIYTDSQYVIKVAKSKNPKLANPDLVRLLKIQLVRVQATFSWVRGHNGHAQNERVDKLARRAAQGKIGLQSVAV